MRKKKATLAKAAGPTFEDLVRSIREVDRDLAAQAKRAVNVSLTLRNWLIGCGIVEYEQRGADRASYGERLLANLSARLVQDGVSRAEERELRRYRQFYQTYPQIREALTPELHKSLGFLALATPGPIWESVTPEFEFSGKDLITRISFTHFAELLAVEDPLKRSFYQAECIRGNWGVRELKRQIASLYFERSALSHNKEKLARLTHAGADPSEPHLTIRDPYVFEFVGLKAREVMSESHLEDQLLDKLQEFLLELGHGFCFEARQKRILIGDSHFFIDLVFYHRILKCHVLIELLCCRQHKSSTAISRRSLR
jgi:predicted nuclease of restriction endonuclease-like (RecB) superfamily